MRRFGAALALFVLAVTNQSPTAAARAPFSVIEATIADMRTALQKRRVTSREIVTQSLLRIATFEDRLHATLYVNPHALADADERDRERRAGRIRGPLHGIPVALKDNIHTTDVPTTGGALAFAGLVPPYEATLTKNLREAGAIILAKTTMTELANWVSDNMPANYNSLSGFAFNPYDPRRDPREATFDGRPILGTGGSSSGIGTAMSFWVANVGTETSGSILSPSDQTMLVGIKPTVGRISRYGVIPIAGEQDTPGPMARTVSDAATMLGVLEGGSPDGHDAATSTCTPPRNRDYTPFLTRTGLKGARLGIPRAYFYDTAATPGERGSQGGLNDDRKTVMADAIAVLRAQGAIVVDPADIPSIVATDPARNLLLWPVCSGAGGAKGRDQDCSVVFKYGMKRDFNAWLASLGDRAPVKTLSDLRAWNKAHERAGTLKYGQSQLDISDEMDLEADRARFEADRAKDLALSRSEGIDAALQANKLDALVFPGVFGAAIAAKAGYPTIVVPFGMIPNARNAPAGFDAKPSPMGVSFTGTACSEPRLIEIAYAFEQATKRRVPPKLD
ncbi:MAG TPA: amidase family protein [Vicinamibacterales bacterium]|jgi:amidase